MKRIAAITMVRGDAFYLRKWTAWYGGQLGEENLYILLDGRDQPLVGQKLGEEADITEDRPFLEQRHYAQLGTRYTKASVLGKPLRWGSGFHRVEGHNLHIVKDLYLFHFGYFDMKQLQERFADADRRAQGWQRHLDKRSRTIRLVTRKKALDFDRWTHFARRFQTVCRPPYAWNKPAMAGLKLVVRIPDRFATLGL